MNRDLRKVVIAGNWKMNKTPLQTVALIGEIKEQVKNAPCGVVLCVPFVDLKDAVATAR
ncbi:hypothetical protein SDC9_200885 [bioreactor metagenome]|uniref:Triose-phosphate isomerase n=1 Tax=bioreactor metagenome TaxID=1076179 RepID=A0A645IPH3_9ZZZZ